MNYSWQIYNFADIYASDEARIFSALKDFTANIRQDSFEGNYVSALQNTNQLSTLLSKKYSPENKGAAESLLLSLEEEKYELEQQLGGIREEILATASGFFYTALDGLEGRAEEKELYSLSPSDISKFKVTLEEYESDSMYVGKVVDTYAWYLAAVVPSEETADIKVGTKVTLSVDEAPSVNARHTVNNSYCGRGNV